MGWFSKKDEKKDVPPAPSNAPQFPSFKTEFPKYESELSHQEMENIKQSVNNDMPPLKRPPIMQRPQVQPRVVPVQPQRRAPLSTYDQPAYNNPTSFSTPFTPEQKEMKEAPIKQGKTMFIKVDQYEDALQKLELITISIQNAEETLQKLEELRNQEAQELTHWKQKLEDVKAQLRTVDRTLFGR